MPLISLSHVLASPMLTDVFSVIRRAQTVSTNGRATSSSQLIPDKSGVVHPSSYNDLKMFPDLQITGKALTIITQFALRSESEVAQKDYLPDIVQWHGDNFIVKQMLDWSSYGPGFVFAICESTDMVDAAPVME